MALADAWTGGSVPSLDAPAPQLDSPRRQVLGNPYHETCLDFTTEEFRTERDNLLAGLSDSVGNDHDMAAGLLSTAWKAMHQTLYAEWDAQLAARRGSLITASSATSTPTTLPADPISNPSAGPGNTGVAGE